MSFLVNLCLSVIIREFARFHYAFKTTHLEHYLQFLQRNYSLEIITKLYITGNLRHRYLRFLLNPNLKKLDCRWLDDLNDKILKRLPNLTQITFNFLCRDEHLKMIANHCPQLLELNVKSSYVTDKGIEYLCQNSQLQTLLVNFCEITRKGINYLIQNLPSLQNIDCNSCIPELLYTLHKDDVTKARKYNLTSLNFAAVSDFSHNFTDILKICLAVCPKLKSVEWCRVFNQKQLDLFKNLPLEILNLNFFNSDINTANFLKSNGFHLTWLSIENCTMSISDLAVSCPKLRLLSITNVTFTDNSFQFIFKYLMKCNIFCYNKNCASIKAIQSILFCSPKLEYVSFNCWTLSPETKDHIVQCCKNRILRRIFFNYSGVDWPFITTLLENAPSPPIIYLNSNRLKIVPEYLRRYQVYTNHYPEEYFFKARSIPLPYFCSYKDRAPF